MAGHTASAAESRRAATRQRIAASPGERAKLPDRVYSLLKTVPKGKVTTYKDLAHALGTRAYRAVGNALRCNPYAPIVPCHRVVRSDGRLGGFMGATRGERVARKSAMLAAEGVHVKDGRVVDFEQKRYRF